jgi:L-amino acid N-acyltransferase YncA
MADAPSNRELVIRPATGDDAEEMAAIYNDAVLRSTATFDLETETPQARRAWLRSPAMRAALVAVSGHRVVGWTSLVRWSDRGAYRDTAEASVYVSSSARRTGIGLALGYAQLDAARRLGVHALIAQICSENAGGLALAKRLGFERVGLLREVGFKFGRWLDVVVCQRLL